MSDTQKSAADLVSRLKTEAKRLNKPGETSRTTLVHLLVEAAAAIRDIPGEVTSASMNEAARSIGEGRAVDGYWLGRLFEAAAALIEWHQQAPGPSEPPPKFTPSPGMALAARLDNWRERFQRGSRSPEHLSGLFDEVRKFIGVGAPLLRCDMDDITRRMDQNRPVMFEELRRIVSRCATSVRMIDALRPGETLQENAAGVEPGEVRILQVHETVRHHVRGESMSTGGVTVTRDPSGVRLTIIGVGAIGLGQVEAETIGGFLAPRPQPQPARFFRLPNAILVKISRVLNEDGLTDESQNMRAFAFTHREWVALRDFLNADHLVESHAPGLGVAESLENDVAALDDISEFLRAFGRDEARVGSKLSAARLTAAARHIEELEAKVRTIEAKPARPHIILADELDPYPTGSNGGAIKLTPRIRQTAERIADEGRPVVEALDKLCERLRAAAEKATGIAEKLAEQTQAPPASNPSRPNTPPTDIEVQTVDGPVTTITGWLLNSTPNVEPARSWREDVETLADLRVRVARLERLVTGRPEGKPLPPRQGAPIHRTPTFEDGVEACAKAVRRVELPFPLAPDHRAALSNYLRDTVRHQA